NRRARRRPGRSRGGRFGPRRTTCLAARNTKLLFTHRALGYRTGRPVIDAEQFATVGTLGSNHDRHLSVRTGRPCLGQPAHGPGIPEIHWESGAAIVNMIGGTQTGQIIYPPGIRVKGKMYARTNIQPRRRGKVPDATPW